MLTPDAEAWGDEERMERRDEVDDP